MQAGSGAGSLFSDEMTMTTSARWAAFPRMIERFLRQRGASALPPRDLERLETYLRSLISENMLPPRVAGRPDWVEIAAACGIDAEALTSAVRVLEPGIDAITRCVGPKAKARKADNGKRQPSTNAVDTGKASFPARRLRGRPRKAPPSRKTADADQPAQEPSAPRRRKRGVQPNPVVEFPEPLTTEWDEPETFPEAFKLHIDRHGDSA